MSIFKRTQRKYVKKAYRVRNWREYEAGLRNRGSLTVWISLTAGKLVNWDAPRPRRRKPGRQRKYSNHAIETAVTLGMVFHLSSRQSEGLLRSLFALMKLDNDVPDHTTILRRKAKLGKVPFYQDKQKTPLHILIDSSGGPARVLWTPTERRDNAPGGVHGKTEETKVHEGIQEGGGPPVQAEDILNLVEIGE